MYVCMYIYIYLGVIKDLESIIVNIFWLIASNKYSTVLQELYAFQV